MESNATPVPPMYYRRQCKLPSGKLGKRQTLKNNKIDYFIRLQDCLEGLYSRLWDCHEGSSSNPEPGVHCGPPLRVDSESNAILVHPITACSAKLPDWLISEAEETLKNIIRRATRKTIGNWDLKQRVNYQISLYPPHENKKIERRVRKIHQNYYVILIYNVTTRNAPRSKDN